MMNQSTIDIFASNEGMTFIQDYQSNEAVRLDDKSDFRTSFYNPFEIKHRKRTSRAQFKVLEKTFLENPKPNAAVRRWLAQQLSMTPRGVQVWFQNRRAKEKSTSSKKKQVIASPTTPSVCACTDCHSDLLNTPMSRTISYPPYYSDASTTDEDELLLTPMSTFIENNNSNNLFFMNSRISQTWLQNAQHWDRHEEENNNSIMLDRRYSYNEDQSNKFIQSTELFRRLSEPIFNQHTNNNLNFDTHFDLLTRSTSFQSL